MSGVANAMIRWLPRERGGRKAPPAGPVYRGMPRFDDVRDRWPEEAWSLVVEMVRRYEREGETVWWARVSFLVKEAPQELLREGARFELCEGKRVVAKGVVMAGAGEAPRELDEAAVGLLG